MMRHTASVRSIIALFALSIGSTLASRFLPSSVFTKKVYQLSRGGSSETAISSQSPIVELDDNIWRNELPEQLQKRS